jgi:4-amino-4-deoxy-L-arabinose transferase-like glycosyltransferase
LVAVNSAMEAAPIEIATGKPVMAMGGFSGNDPAMTVERLQNLVKTGQLRYTVVTLRGGFPGGPGGRNGAVSAWIQQHGKPVNYGASAGNAVLYDLSPDS